MDSVSQVERRESLRHPLCEKPPDLLSQIQSGPHGAPRLVAEALRHAKDGHEAVTGEFVDQPP